MQELFNVYTSNGSYEVQIGRKKSQLLSDKSNSIYLLDQFVIPFVEINSENVISIAATEDAKEYQNIALIFEQLKRLNVGRDTHIVAVGGGVIQDIATFVASLYMRGLSWSYFPTTLLSMVDSCIGGKSSINLGSRKNLIGNIYPPMKVVIDPCFCESLGVIEMVGGLIEAIKILYAQDSRLSNFSPTFLSLNQIRDENSLCALIYASLQAKKWFIEIDEFDKRERLLLNYGHTFGHAIESASGYQITHGIAVGIGILVANYYAVSNNKLSSAGQVTVGKLNQYLLSILEPIKSDLKPLLSRTSISSVTELFQGDKKHNSNFFKIIIPIQDGGLAVETLKKDHDSIDAIGEAYQQCIGKLI